MVGEHGDFKFGAQNKCTPIFKISSVTNPQGNSPSNHDRYFQLTSTMSLHYLVKSENSKQLCFKNDPFVFS